MVDAYGSTILINLMVLVFKFCELSCIFVRVCKRCTNKKDGMETYTILRRPKGLEQV